MASEEVNKILNNLTKLKETKLGEGDKKDEVEELKQELDDEMAKREEAERKAIETQEDEANNARQIIVRSVEVLNNDGIYRHAMLEKANLIERHLKVIAVCLVKMSGVEETPVEEPETPVQD
jgi:hypothetical protein